MIYYDYTYRDESFLSFYNTVIPKIFSLLNDQSYFIDVIFIQILYSMLMNFMISLFSCLQPFIFLEWEKIMYLDNQIIINNIKIKSKLFKIDYRI